MHHGTKREIPIKAGLERRDWGSGTGEVWAGEDWWLRRSGFEARRKVV